MTFRNDACVAQGGVRPEERNPTRKAGEGEDPVRFVLGFFLESIKETHPKRGTDTGGEKSMGAG